MALSIFDLRRGARVDLALSSPPALKWRAGPGARERAVAEAFARTAGFLGLSPRRCDTGSVDLQVGGEDPGPGRAWLSVGQETGDGLADPLALDFLRFKTHYREALRVDSAALGAARAERERLVSASRGLADVSLAASSRAVAGYLYRFREALNRDFASPEALACVWDALRPGALSPGSRAALLRETFPVIGLP